MQNLNLWNYDICVWHPPTLIYVLISYFKKIWFWNPPFMPMSSKSAVFFWGFPKCEISIINYCFFVWYVHWYFILVRSSRADEWWFDDSYSSIFYLLVCLSILKNHDQASDLMLISFVKFDAVQQINWYLQVFDTYKLIRNKKQIRNNGKCITIIKKKSYPQGLKNENIWRTYLTWLCPVSNSNFTVI